MREGKVVSLWAACGEFAVPARTWLNMLSLARWYGWEPMGTAPPAMPDLIEPSSRPEGRPQAWDGRYFPGDFQIITEDDAKALAASLTRALPDIPQHAAMRDKALPGGAEGSDDYAAWGQSVRAGETVNPFEEFSGKNKAILCDFIAHCFEEGGLWIG